VPLVAPEQGASLPWCKDAACSSISITYGKKYIAEYKFELGDM
jgi:hypothetical protein